MEKTQAAYIETRPTRSGETRTFVAGTRIRVADIYVLHELRGYSADDIVAAYPHLSLAQVYAALSYCFDHLDGIREEIRHDGEIAAAIREQTGAGPLERKLGPA